MEKIRRLLHKPVVIAVLGVVVGLVLGLGIGWGIWPVQWYDAAKKDLRKDLQEDIMRMTIESYAKNGNKALAMQRWQEFGPAAKEVFRNIEGNISPDELNQFKNLVQPPIDPISVKPTPKTVGIPLLMVLGVLCVVVLITGGAIYLSLKHRGAAVPPVEKNHQLIKTDQQEDTAAQFTTTYSEGDDLYDDSFSIYTSSELIGECGVGIAETASNDPKKVWAFEVWLLDKKNDQTITKVLMSEFVFNNPAIRQRLASKGEPVLIEPGQHVLLETADLQLEVRVEDMKYGQSDPLPKNSFFEKLTLGLSAWPKS
jgi:hypothetical protein